MKIDIKKLSKSIACAIKLEYESIRAVNTSKKIKLLLDNKEAGHEYEFKAKVYLEQRSRYLSFAKQWITSQYKKVVEKYGKQIEEFYNKVDINNLFKSNMQLLKLRLLDSDVSPEEFKNAIEQLDIQQREIKKLISFEELYNYLQNQMEESIKRYGNPDYRIISPVIAIICLFIAINYGLIFFACLFGAIAYCAGRELAGEDCDVGLVLSNCLNKFNRLCYPKKI